MTPAEAVVAAAKAWAAAYDTEPIRPDLMQIAEGRLLIAVASLHAETLPRSMFDQSWTPRDEMMLHPASRAYHDLAESLARIEQFANEGES